MLSGTIQGLYVQGKALIVVLQFLAGTAFLLELSAFPFGQTLWSDQGQAQSMIGFDEVPL